MIRDMQWAYRLGFKRGWKVGNRRGRNANLIGYNAGIDFNAVSCGMEQAEIRNECDHLEDGYDSTNEGLIYTRFTYCPKCGEKL